MADGSMILAFKAVAPNRPRKMVLGTNFTAPAHSKALATISIPITAPPVSTGAIVEYEASFVGATETPVPIPAAGPFPFSIPFTPFLYRSIQTWGVATWAAQVRLRARSAEHGFGAYSDPVSVTVDQDGTFFIADANWTFDEERDFTLSGGIDGRPKITVSGAVVLPAGPIELRRHGGPLAWSVENFPAIQDTAVSLVIAPGGSFLGAAGNAIGSTIHGNLAWRDTATNAWHLATNKRSITVQGVINPALPGLTTAPVLSGNGKIGSSQSVTDGTWTGAPTIAKQWLLGDVEIAGQTGANYTPVAGDDLSALRVRVRATNAGGMVETFSNILNITYPAPTVANPVSDQVLTQEAGASVSIDYTSVFAGSNLTRTLQSAPPDVSFNPSTVSLAIDKSNVRTITPVTVRASNSGGFVDDAFNLTINAGAPTITWPAAINDAHWAVTEVTDPAVATAQGFTGESGHLKLTTTAAINPTPTTGSGTFQLVHELLGEAVGSPSAALANVTISQTFYTPAGSFRPVGADANPRVWWRGPGAAVQFQIAGTKTPFEIVGLTLPPPPPGAFPFVPAAQLADAKGKPLARYENSRNGTPNAAFFGHSVVIEAYGAFTGDTTCDPHVLAQIRHSLIATNCPSGRGGFGQQHVYPIIAAYVLAKLTPRVWNALTAGERAKVDLLVKGCTASGAIICSDTYALAAIRDKGLMADPVGTNANFRVANPLMAIAGRIFLGSNAAFLQFLQDFDKTAFRDLVAAQGLTNMAAVMAPQPAPAPTQAQCNAAISNTWTYTGKTIAQHQDILIQEANICFNKNCMSGLGGTAANGWIGPGIAGRGKIAANAAGLPNKGAIGMLQEFDGQSGGGARSSGSYSEWGSRLIVIGMLLGMCSGLLNRNAAAVQTLSARLNIGRTDMEYKMTNGYLSRDGDGGAGNEDWTTALRSTEWGWSYGNGIWRDIVKPWLDGG